MLLLAIAGTTAAAHLFLTLLLRSLQTSSIVGFVLQKQNKNEFCVIELHVATSDDAKTSCGYFCGIFVHVLDVTLSTTKVRFVVDFYAQQQSSQFIAILSVCPSVCLSVCHTVGSVKNDASKLGSPNLHHRVSGRL